MAFTHEQADEIRFWAPQLTEHCLFIYLGLEPGLPVRSWVELRNPILEDEKVSTRTQASEAMLKKQAEVTAVVQNLKDEAKKLVEEWTKLDQDISRNELSYDTLDILLQRTQRLKMNIIELLKNKYWVGWLYQSFVEHILHELEYFIKRLHNRVTVQEEIAFWTQIAAEHTGFTAHLLDINTSKEQRQLVNTVLSKADAGFKLLEEDIDFVQMIRLTDSWTKAYEYQKDIQSLVRGTWTKFQENKVNSIIHPSLLAHVVRETERGMRRLEQLGQTIPQEQRAAMVQLRSLSGL